MVTFELFARPMLEALAGMSPRKIKVFHAKLKSEIRIKPGLKRFLPAILSGEFEHTEVELVRWQGSGDIAATALANCYIVVPEDREQIKPANTSQSCQPRRTLRLSSRDGWSRHNSAGDRDVAP